jgi:hypothetical protein
LRHDILVEEGVDGLIRDGTHCVIFNLSQTSVGIGLRKR